MIPPESQSDAMVIIQSYHGLAGGLELVRAVSGDNVGESPQQDVSSVRDLTRGTRDRMHDDERPQSGSE
jgi:hypothetical protein